MDGMGVDIQFQGCNLQVMNPKKVWYLVISASRLIYLAQLRFLEQRVLEQSIHNEGFFCWLGSWWVFCVPVTRGVSKGQPVILSKKKKLVNDYNLSNSL